MQLSQFLIWGENSPLIYIPVFLLSICVLLAAVVVWLLFPTAAGVGCCLLPEVLHGPGLQAGIRGGRPLLPRGGDDHRRHHWEGGRGIQRKGKILTYCLQRDLGIPACYCLFIKTVRSLGICFILFLRVFKLFKIFHK